MQINKLKSLFYILVLFFTLITDVIASPKIFIEKLTSDASQILAGGENKNQKMVKLIELAEQNVDIKGIGIYTLGKYRKTISESQKQEYNELFRSYFLKSFSSRLSEYSDPKINVVSKTVLNEKYTMVSSILVATDKRPEIKIDWRVYTKNPEKPLIRDLIIEGLSLARTQKEEFSSVIQSADGDITVLFNNLKDFVK